MGDALWSRETRKMPFWHQLGFLVLKTLYIVATGVRRERLKLRAGALTYVSLLSLVPAVAVMFSVFAAFGGMEEVRKRLAETIVGVIAVRDQAQILGYLEQFVGNVHAGKLGAAGVVILLFTALSLLTNIEKSFNDIFGLTEDRTWLRRFLVYWVLLTVGPPLLGFSLSVTTAFLASDALRTFSSGFSLLFDVGPSLVVWSFFTLLYLILPNTRVSVRAAAAGGFVAGGFWLGAQKLYALYASYAVGYATIYGSLGAVPLFILWIYVSWLVTLLGATLTYALQSASTYEPEGKRLKTLAPRVAEFVAVRLMASVCRSYDAGQGPRGTAELLGEIGVAPKRVRQLLQELAAGGLLVAVEGPAGPTGYLPGRPSATIFVGDVLKLVRMGPHGAPFLENREGDKSPVLEVLNSIERAVASEGQKVSMAQLATALSSEDPVLSSSEDAAVLPDAL